MLRSVSSDMEKDLLHDWVEEETRQLDVVASWESLCDTYRALEFSDPLSDTVKLEEFKWIIREMNKFLTRMRSKLMSCKDLAATMDLLEGSFVPTGKVSIDGRRSLAYQKLRQRWVTRMLMMAREIETKEVEDDGYAR